MNQKIKISQLPAKGSNLAAQDLLEIAEFTGTGYVSKSITGAEIAAGATAGFVPETRTLTINGVTQDLSANRTFTISTGITIGSTAIASGTVGRILFEGTGNVVQQSSSLFWDNTNARLGIGTSSPRTNISIVGANDSSPVLGSANGKFTVLNGPTNGTYGLVFGVQGSGISHIQSQRVDGSATAYALAIQPAGGNVLIGTTTDAGFRLDVNGTARVQNVLTIQNLTADLYVRTTAWSGQSRIWFGDDSSDTIGGINYEHQFDRMNLRTNAGTRMSIFSTGNVGINTTTDAGFRLDVNGTARVSGLVTANGYRVATNGEGLTASSSTVGIVSYGANGASSGYTFTLNNQYGGGNINRNFFAVGDNFYLTSAFSSGTNTTNWFGVYPVINNTGGTTTSRGFYYNPTLTNTTGTTHYAFHSTSGLIRFENLPTSAAGLPAGTLYNNLGVLMIA